MTGFLKRLYRERRRALVIAALTFLSGFITYYDDPARFFGVPLSVIAGLAFLGGLTPCLGVIFLVFPKIRHTTESVAFSLPVLALIGVFSRAPIEAGFAPSLNILGILMCYLTLTIYGSTAIDRFLPRRTARFRSHATSTLPPETLWPYLDLTPDSAPRHISDDLVSMHWIDPANTYHETSRSGDVAQIEAIVTLRTPDRPFTRFARFEVPNAKPNTPSASGTHAQQLVTIATGSALHSTRELNNHTLRSYVFLWIDDAFGRLADADILKAEKKERSLPSA